jgi:hypothetical protein
MRRLAAQILVRAKRPVMNIDRRTLLTGLSATLLLPRLARAASGGVLARLNHGCVERWAKAPSAMPY